MWKIDFPDMKPFLRILLPAAVCGLLLGACTQRQTTLKFMSYNIRNGRGIDNVQDLGRGLPESAVVTERQVDTSTVASDHCPLWVSLAWKK